MDNRSDKLNIRHKRTESSESRLAGLGFLGTVIGSTTTNHERRNIHDEQPSANCEMIDWTQEKVKFDAVLDEALSTVINKNQINANITQDTQDTQENIVLHDGISNGTDLNKEDQNEEDQLLDDEDDTSSTNEYTSFFDRWSIYIVSALSLVVPCIHACMREKYRHWLLLFPMITVGFLVYGSILVAESSSVDLVQIMGVLAAVMSILISIAVICTSRSRSARPNNNQVRNVDRPQVAGWLSGVNPQQDIGSQQRVNNHANDQYVNRDQQTQNSINKRPNKVTFDSGASPRKKMMEKYLVWCNRKGGTNFSKGLISFIRKDRDEEGGFKYSYEDWYCLIVHLCGTEKGYTISNGKKAKNFKLKSDHSNLMELVTQITYDHAKIMVMEMPELIEEFRSKMARKQNLRKDSDVN